MNSTLNTPFDHWTANFGFIWYNDAEIFQYSQDDFDRVAFGYAKRGINIVIGFSCTHFRWSMYDYRAEIHRAIRMHVEACHKHNIRYVEHHSSSLSFDPLDQDDIDYTRRVLKLRSSSLESWPKMQAHWQSNRDINGVPMNSMRQVDGRTGGLTRSHYRGWVMCPNNPDFLREYLAYLETVYALGVDGIMTDDMQYYGKRNSCACSICRKLFKVTTGFELPEYGDAWNKWFDDHDDPSYIAWLDFRVRSIEKFNAAVLNHYKGLGLNLLRPNYCSDVLCGNWSAYALETLPALHWVGSECCYSSIIRYAWSGHWSAELAHRFAVGRVRDLPVNAYYYPDRVDTALFTWAFSKVCGVGWVPTPEGGNTLNEVLDLEARLRAFESEHKEIYLKPGKLSRIGFHDSRTNRELNKFNDLENRTYQQLKSWTHHCFRNNIPFDIFVEEEFQDAVGRYSTIVLNEIVLISDEHLNALSDFASSGGTVILTGRTGNKTDCSRDRSQESLRIILGITDFNIPDDTQWPVVYPKGKGQIIAVGNAIGSRPTNHHAHYADRWQIPAENVKYQIDNDSEQKGFDEVFNVLKDTPGYEDLQTTFPRDVIVSMFYHQGSGMISLNILNACGALCRQETDVISHDDEIPFPAIKSDATICIRKHSPRLQKCFVSASYHDPINMTSLALEYRQDKESISVDIPVGIFSKYGVIELR